VSAPRCIAGATASSSSRRAHPGGICIAICSKIQRFAADYRKAGGDIDLLLLEGAQHTFLNEHPFEPNSVKALNAMIAFIKKHGPERHAQR
jgi:acetyl esterase/lipase